MAALVGHGSLVNALKCSTAILAVNTTSLRYDVARFKSRRPQKKPPAAKRTFENEERSLTCKGFLRYRTAYNPPNDVSERISKICDAQQIPSVDETKLDDPLQRFNVFQACEREFQHPIMNSVLYSIETVGNLKEYYETAVNNVTPLDAMRSMDLPKNLHVNFDYTRFHPETDTMFNGKTAFPKSSTLVTGLKYKKKYPGHQQEDPYLDLLLKI